MLHAADSLTAADVRRIMAGVIGRRGAPTRIKSDNGSEFICEVVVNRLPGVGAKSIPVAAASPWENGYIGIIRFQRAPKVFDTSTRRPERA